MFPSTRYDFYVGQNHNKGFIIIANKAALDGSKPWVWFAPTFYNNFPCKLHDWMFNQLLANGFAICGVDVGESFGSPHGRKIYSDFYEYVISKYRLNPQACFIAQSRGGLMAYNWAAENPKKIKCIAGIYTVCDLNSYPSLNAASLYTCPPAYNMTHSQLCSNLENHNPIDRLTPLADNHIPILHIHGDVDTVVPLEKNSKLLVQRYKDLGGHAELIVVNGKGHEEVPEFFQAQLMVDFLISQGTIFPSNMHD